MPRFLTIILFIICTVSSVFGQSVIDSTLNKSVKPINPDKNISILTGINFWGNFYGELGVGVYQNRQSGHHFAGLAYFVSNEIKIDDKILIGPKAGVWIGGGLAFGLNLIYYTDFDESSLRFRPEIGIGMGNVKIVYGYNIPLTNKNFNRINKSNIGIAVMFGVKKIKINP